MDQLRVHSSGSVLSTTHNVKWTAFPAVAPFVSKTAKLFLNSSSRCEKDSRPLLLGKARRRGEIMITNQHRRNGNRIARDQKQGLLISLGLAGALGLLITGAIYTFGRPQP